MTTPVVPPDTSDIEIVSVDALYELSEWALDEEHDRANVIDTKCAAIFTSSSFLVAGMAALQVAIGAHVSTLPAHTPTPWWESSARWLGVGVALTFLIVVGASLWAMKPRTFTIAPAPPVLLKKYYKKSTKDVKELVMKSRVAIYDETVATVSFKARWMIVSFIAVAVESLFLVFILAIAAIAL